MENIKTIDFWIPAISALVALGIITLEPEGINDYAAQIVTAIAVLGTLFDTLKRLFTQ